jgi:hypothetical protein
VTRDPELRRARRYVYAALPLLLAALLVLLTSDMTPGRGTVQRIIGAALFFAATALAWRGLVILQRVASHVILQRVASHDVVGSPREDHAREHIAADRAERQ